MIMRVVLLLTILDFAPDITTLGISLSLNLVKEVVAIFDFISQLVS